MTVAATVRDPDGRDVELTTERWNHIVQARPLMAGLQPDVLRAVAAPTRHRPGREPDEVWFYLEHAGPSRWLKVVVVFEPDRAFIVTAFPRRSLP